MELTKASQSLTHLCLAMLKFVLFSPLLITNILVELLPTLTARSVVS